MRPPSFRRAAASRSVLKVPRTLMSKVWSYSASDVSASGVGFITPALLTSTSTLPSSRSVISNMRRTSSGFDTSACTATALPPASRIAATSASASPALDA
jgi:hypothetical protein